MAAPALALELHQGLRPVRSGARSVAAVASAASLFSVAHSVSDLASVSTFYEKTLGLTVLEDGTHSDGRTRRLLGGDAAALKLELREAGAAGAPPDFVEAGAYRGLSARVPDVAVAASAAVANGGTVVLETSVRQYGPALVPDQPDETRTNVTRCIVADPAGYPLWLYQDPTCTGQGELCAARLDVTAWKASEAWWGGLGFSTLRWQSNLKEEASITVTVGDADGVAVGPCGPEGGAGAVVQLRYVYMAPNVTQATGLEAFVLHGASFAGGEPDCYPLSFEG